MIITGATDTEFPDGMRLPFVEAHRLPSSDFSPIIGRENNIAETAEMFVVSGYRNNIGEGCHNVAVMNSSGCTIAGGAHFVSIYNSSGVTVYAPNVMVMNSSGITVTEKGSVWMNSQKIGNSSGVASLDFELKTFTLAADGSTATINGLAVPVTDNGGSNYTINVTTSKRLKEVTVDCYSRQMKLNKNFGSFTPFKEYEAIITQVTSSAPTIDFASINTTGDTLTPARSSSGVYTFTAGATPFTASKTFVTIPSSMASPATQYGSVFPILTSTSVITLYTFALDSTPTDSILNKACFNIKIYSGWTITVTTVNGSSFDLTFQMNGGSATALSGSLQIIEQ